MKKEEQDIELKVIAGEQEDVAAEEEQLEEAQEDLEEPQIKLQEAIKEQAREDESEHSATFTLRKILGGDFLTAEMLRRQIGVVLLVLFFIIVYISNRYSCQKSLIEIDQLNMELQDAKYRALSSASELTERCRESNVLEMLRIQKDSTLKIPSEPPYIVEIKN